MKTLNVILFFLLVFSSMAAAAGVKPPAVLLQEGIYAEENEGNLDKAMQIYSQIREKYNDVERISAIATYQLGLCYLKKNDNKKAAQLFQEVIGYYPEQTSAVKKAQQQLDKMGIQKADEGNFFEILGQISAYIGSKYGEISAEAGTKKLYSNCHIYLADNDFVLRTGGMGYIYNWTTEPITKHYRISGTSYPSQKLYDVVGKPMDTEIVPDENRSGFYNIYWNPKEPIQPGGYFYYGWAMDGSKPLTHTSDVVALASGGVIRSSEDDLAHQLKMQNHFGDHCYETFFLVVPQGTAITSQSEEYTNKGNLNGRDIYWWKKEVPENNDHTVNVTLTSVKKVSEEELLTIVQRAVLTISTCAETDPRVALSLNSLKGLDHNLVVSELTKYLDDPTATVRRSAIFILWKGGFDNIAPAEEKLLKLCKHEENFTRGMAAIALGAAKIPSSFETLKEMTLNDKDGYVRRCAAYALGLYGDKEALPVLEKALGDEDQMVKNNAQAAITMLTKLNDPNK
jgi:tetratricopeptide (TPR) repeat protein